MRREGKERGVEVFVIVGREGNREGWGVSPWFPGSPTTVMVSILTSGFLNWGLVLVFFVKTIYKTSDSGHFVRNRLQITIISEFSVDFFIYRFIKKRNMIVQITSLKPFSFLISMCKSDKD